MDDVVLLRHGESATAAAGVVGGDAKLTKRGRAQAKEAGLELACRRFDVCLVSPAERAQETAAIALEGRDVLRETVPEFADIGFGEFTGRPLQEYRDWIASHSPLVAPEGGESRAATLRRFCSAYRTLLERPERQLLVVAHGLTLSAVTDHPPQPVVAGVPYAWMVALTRDEVRAAVARLERWCEAPAW